MSDNSLDVKEDNKSELTFIQRHSMKILVLGMVIAIIAAFGCAKYINPWLKEKSAREGLNNFSGSGQITAINTDMVMFKGQKIQNANVNQKALGKSGNATSPPAFIFSDKNANGKVLDIYVDFDSARSRDFILLNKNNLRNMVESNGYILKIHPVPTGKAYTIYSAEAISECFVTSPSKCWDFMLELLKNSVTVDSNKTDDIVKNVVTTANRQKISGIDDKSLKNGTFSSWIISAGDDPRLKAEFYPPLIYVDNKLISGKDINLNNSDDFRKAVQGK